MIASEKQANAETRKEKIAERYKGVDPSLLEVIPAENMESVDITQQHLKVAAYIRVSTENDEQQSSFNLQEKEFTERIEANPLWDNAGIYSDEGISGTELSHRKGMLQMIEDAKAGKIQLILAKSIARFARNVVDCLSIIEELKKLDPPVGVHFDEGNIYTLDSSGSVVLTVLATVAEEESRSKSFIMNWSIEKRFSRGIFLTPELLGYDKDEDGKLVVNSTEAETVKVIFDLYLNGWSTPDIADLLAQYGRLTKFGNRVWHPSAVMAIIRNERYVGDVLARKTYTPNYKDHKVKKNRHNRNQYRQRDHHEAIISRDAFDAANQIQESMRFAKENRTLPVLSVVEEGVLKGYVPVHKDWTGFTGEEYRIASESVEVEVVPEIRPIRKQINFSGYQTVRGEFYGTLDRPALTISAGRMRFNKVCLDKFVDVEYVELLLNPTKRCIAIRPCSSDNPNAIRWGKLKEGRWAVRDLSCRGLSRVLVDVMDWTAEDRYRFCGEFTQTKEGKLLLFTLDEPVITRTETRIYVPEKEDTQDHAEADTEQGTEEVVFTETVKIYPPSWAETFGKPITSIAAVSLLERRHYAEDWDVLRPAQAIEELSILTKNRLEELMQEAETIIEGWSTDDGNGNADN